MSDIFNLFLTFACPAFPRHSFPNSDTDINVRTYIIYRRGIEVAAFTSRPGIHALSLKPPYSYRLRYSIDKKAYNKGKKHRKRIAGIKQMLNFADNKERSHQLVINFARIIISDRIE